MTKIKPIVSSIVAYGWMHLNVLSRPDKVTLPQREAGIVRRLQPPLASYGEGAWLEWYE